MAAISSAFAVIFFILSFDALPRFSRVCLVFFQILHLAGSARMKTQQGMALLITLLAANTLMAQGQQGAPQQTLTFPPQQVVGNQVQYPGIGQQGWQFPSQTYFPQQTASPYAGYAYPGYSPMLMGKLTTRIMGRGKSTALTRNIITLMHSPMPPTPCFRV
ncbi:MAG: hypothetical protein HZT40_03680 [Candidatus Thiothrix singaporensis]|uniref:Uncharacterized protein n=1 Tax=Candidatus Thiothrix singaporensis TaxID=2799669 RepID=A0A7L6AP24_9GAMM|nr:MAG: hypothetical protein HZT40_03680 [Candidatus Thiothrix singaporensis]